MKSCDICKKFTAFLEDLEYCSVCVDCYAEITEVEEDSFSEIFNIDDNIKEDNIQ